MNKKILLIPLVFLLSGCSLKENENLYKIELNNEPYEVCGKQIYFSNDAWGNELNINDIIETIQDACNVNN